MNFLVYSKNGCPYCYKVMQVLEMTGKQFVEYKLGRDFTGQEFYDKFGEGSTFPQVLCDDRKLIKLRTVKLIAGLNLYLMEGRSNLNHFI
jgi:glutaredoxin